MKRFAFAVCAVAIAITIAVILTGGDASQYGRIDAFYAEVKSDPNAFPEDVRSVIEYIDKTRDSGVGLSRAKPAIEDPNTAPIMAMLKLQTTPEQVSAYETWMKATGEASMALRHAVDHLGLNSEKRNEISYKYNDFIRARFGAPTVAKRNTEKGIEYFIVKSDQSTN